MSGITEVDSPLGPRILLIEDDEEWQKIIKDDLDAALKRLDSQAYLCVTSTFSEGRRALTRQGRWDILVTDIGLSADSESQKRGMQLVRSARGSNIPCIVVSGTPHLDKSDVDTILATYKARRFFNKDDFNDEFFIDEIIKILQEANKPFSLPQGSVSSNNRRPENTRNNRIYIGHGRSKIWEELKNFISETLKLPWDEFNRESVAGRSTKERLEEMLQEARFAFLVMTAEDEHADGTVHARENVIHEAGLFQGKLGFSKAIILIEDGCKEFSNIHGLTQIRFPPGNMLAVSEQLIKVLKREGIIRIENSTQGGSEPS
jgi:predicted nucleotide-binding protein